MKKSNIEKAYRGNPEAQTLAGLIESLRMRTVHWKDALNVANKIQKKYKLSNR